jgi:glycosyltransferase involved in cell wall biosynthesis
VHHAIARANASVPPPRRADGIVCDDGAPPLAIADSAESVAARIVELLDDPAQRRALGARARATAEAHHSAAAYGARLEAAYAELLAARAVERAS